MEGTVCAGIWQINGNSLERPAAMWGVSGRKEQYGAVRKIMQKMETGGLPGVFPCFGFVCSSNDAGSGRGDGGHGIAA